MQFRDLFHPDYRDSDRSEFPLDSLCHPLSQAVVCLFPGKFTAWYVEWKDGDGHVFLRDASGDVLDMVSYPDLLGDEGYDAGVPVRWRPRLPTQRTCTLVARAGLTFPTPERVSRMALAPDKTPYLFTVDEYLAFERAAAERHEYLDGVIYAMAGESLAHGDICTNLTLALANQLRGTPCRVLSKDTKVRSGPALGHTRQGLRSYPDLVVICGEPRYHDQHQDVLLNPTVLIEVLSPTTAAFDRGEKFYRYRRWLPSLQEYVLVAQDQPQVEHASRLEADRWTLDTLQGLDATLMLASVSCQVPLVDIYDRVVFPATVD